MLPFHIIKYYDDYLLANMARRVVDLFDTFVLITHIIALSWCCCGSVGGCSLFSWTICNITQSFEVIHLGHLLQSLQLCILLSSFSFWISLECSTPYIIWTLFYPTSHSNILGWETKIRQCLLKTTYHWGNPCLHCLLQKARLFFLEYHS